MYTIAKLYRNGYWSDYYVDDNGTEKRIHYYDDNLKRFYLSFTSMFVYVTLENVAWLTTHLFFVLTALCFFQDWSKPITFHGGHYLDYYYDDIVFPCTPVSIVVIVMLMTILIRGIQGMIKNFTDFTCHYVDVNTQPSPQLFMKYYGTLWDNHQSKIYEYKNKTNDHKQMYEVLEHEVLEQEYEQEYEELVDENDTDEEYVDGEYNDEAYNDEEYKDEDEDEDEEYDTFITDNTLFLENKAPCTYSSIESYKNGLFREYTNKNLALKYSIIMRVVTTANIFDANRVIFYCVTENGSFHRIANIDMTHRTIHTSDNIHINVGIDEPTPKVYEMHESKYAYYTSTLVYNTLYKCYKDFRYYASYDPFEHYEVTMRVGE